MFALCCENYVSNHLKLLYYDTEIEPTIYNSE